MVPRSLKLSTIQDMFCQSQFGMEYNLIMMSLNAWFTIKFFLNYPENDPPGPSRLAFTEKKSTFHQKAPKKFHFFSKSTQKSPLSPKNTCKKVHFFPQNTCEKVHFLPKSTPPPIQIWLLAWRWLYVHKRCGFTIWGSMYTSALKNSMLECILY